MKWQKPVLEDITPQDYVLGVCSSGSAATASDCLSGAVNAGSGGGDARCISGGANAGAGSKCSAGGSAHLNF